uniref:tRNA wybutosine-synthesizing protein 3 homolog n=1 Tax=Petromyzon marinus TaxID=7757 RepID=A0AAJ7TB07_PETMA|nr:tRNA wybutosine-synthesizing protein 3 homolog [Petromyzon marinus]
MEEACFGRRKEQRLLARDGSRKGGVDAAIVALLRILNAAPGLCSTSSCAGRLVLRDQETGGHVVQKQGCRWLLVTHEELQLGDLVEGLRGATGDSVFKFEPFVLHVHCLRLEEAQLLHMVAVESGFRNSGITVGKKGKIIVAVRSTHALEVPLCQAGRLMVPHDYLAFLVAIANGKMAENRERVARFQEKLRQALENAAGAAMADGTERPRDLAETGGRRRRSRSRPQRPRRPTGASRSTDSRSRVHEPDGGVDDAIVQDLRVLL